jgi:hypothetical protein
MAIDKNSTGYTFLFSIVMVVVVGTSLAYTSLSLKERQNANAADKKMMDILGAIGVDANRNNASKLFADYVVERVAIDMSGRELMATSSAVDPKDKQDPFGIDVKKDYRASVKSAVKATDGDEAALMACALRRWLAIPTFPLRQGRCEPLRHSYGGVWPLGAHLGICCARRRQDHDLRSQF